MKNESLFVWLLIVAMGFLLVYSTFQGFYNIPAKNDRIAILQAKADRAMELEVAVADYQRAMKFEKLFLMVADANQIMDFAELEHYIENKAVFCLGDCREVGKCEK